jgi:hypothetical protein
VNIPREIDCIIDILYCTLAGCMITQQEHELDMREGLAGSETLLANDTLSPPIEKTIMVEETQPPYHENTLYQ